MNRKLISTIVFIISSFIGPALAAPPQLTLVKEVVGGEATIFDWVLTADGTADNDLSGAGSISKYVDPDTFELSESTGPAGYIAGDWDCVGGGTLVGQSLTLSADEVVTCTIINTYEPPVVIFDTDFALPSMPVGGDSGTPVCIDDASGLLVAGCTVTITADEIDPASVQRRVEDVCAEGYSIRVINDDGSVVCEPDTDAATLCADGQFLNGDGSCDPVVVDTDTNAATLCVDGQFLNGDGSCDPVVVDTDTNAATICSDGQFLNGDGSCYTAKPEETTAIFGSGPITHYDAGNWVLESTLIDTLALRSTSTDFLRFSMTYPVNCTGDGAGGTADMKQVFRYSVAIGNTVTGTFCAEGSTILVTVLETATDYEPMFFFCTRSSGNAHLCQRYWH